MGMFDSIFDANGDEWQTKAFGKILEQYEIGDAIPPHSIDYQVEVYGGPFEAEWVESFATFRRGRLVAVPAERDEALPLLDYHGAWIAQASTHSRSEDQ